MSYELIRNSALFKLLDDEQFEQLSSRLQFHKLHRADVLYSEGSPADSVSIVLTGTLEAVKMSALGGEETVLSEFGPADVIGEMALLSDRRRSASIRAQEACELASLTRAAYGAMEKQRPDIALLVMKSVARILAQRLQDTSADLADECA